MDPSGPGPGRVRGRGRVLEVLDPSGPGPLKSWGSAMSSLLQPFPIPDGKCHTCTIDFMTDLPEINEYNALTVVVEKFGKFSQLVPCRAGEG